jgi:glycosyltransferase involved in cell wall biosynthesis
VTSNDRAPAETRRPTVLGFGTYDTRVHPRAGTVLAALAARGALVLECTEPLGLSTAQRVAMLRQPWRLPLLAARLLGCWARLAARARRRFPEPDVIVVGYLGHFDVHLAKLLFRRTPIVLDHLIGAGDTAADRRVGGRLRGGLLRGLDRAALRAADLVIVDTQEHRDLVPPDLRYKVVVTPVGAPQPWFDAAPAADGLEKTTVGDNGDAGDSGGTGHGRGQRRLRIVFYGLYTPLQGAPVIGEALALLADEPIDVTMIGNGQDRAATKRAAAPNPHVTWVDWVPAEDLPALVAGHDVCLGIFGTTPKARRVVPNKVYQGLAAGCAVVTSDTGPQRRALDDAALFVPPGDPKALAEALRSLANRPDELARSRVAARELAEQRFTAHGVTGELAERLRTLPGLEALT